ncbi:MAG: hypothetical protein KDA31_00025 [Phycisphaerales bacterium]|nr:hypothetical protein [Phycisphaerales bacterium]MCB9837311.1 hypothetical protein [Phycisphaera sp.]
MSDTNRDIFIALIDAGLDESTILSFIEGASVDAAAIVEALGTDAHLADLVWQLRADRQALMEASTPSVTLAETEAMVESVLEQELVERIDADDLAAIEQSGRSSSDVRKPTHKPVKVRRVRRMPSRAKRITYAFAAAAAVVLVLGVVLPRLDFDLDQPKRTERTIAEANEGQDAPIRLAQDDAQDTSEPVETSPKAIEDRPSISSRPLSRPIVVASASDALELARQGRLIVRLSGSRASSIDETRRLLAGDSELARFAAVEGAVEEERAIALANALPITEQPILASGDDAPASAPRTTRVQRGAYMLRVEPSERAFTLLIAKLRSDRAMTIELVGSVEPVTTPATARDITSLAGEPASWRSRISVPVVVEAIE